MRQTTATRVLGILIGVVLLGGGSILAQPEPQATVAMDAFEFKPADLTVSAGIEVVWTNKDSESHTVSARDRSFDSGTLDQGKIFKVRFPRAGTFTYACEFHPTMTGKVVVR